ncbi:unnamed protein product [Amoebophrya sp. A120]|nr:unnamed protein product [Amoebophrya sp. A120]|eukprot:GSA120T00015662001.1
MPAHQNKPDNYKSAPRFGIVKRNCLGALTASAGVANILGASAFDQASKSGRGDFTLTPDGETEGTDVTSADGGEGMSSLQPNGESGPVVDTSWRRTDSYRGMGPLNEMRERSKWKYTCAKDGAGVCRAFLVKRSNARQQISFESEEEMTQRCCKPETCEWDEEKCGQTDKL